MGHSSHARKMQGSRLRFGTMYLLAVIDRLCTPHVAVIERFCTMYLLAVIDRLCTSHVAVIDRACTMHLGSH